MNRATPAGRLALAGMLAFLGSCQFRVKPHSSDEARVWAREYGGAPAGYAAILASTDCAELRDEFDRIEGEIGVEVPGSAGRRATVGFMTATRTRMIELGCSDVPARVPAA
jgi:hypothetical protein